MTNTWFNGTIEFIEYERDVSKNTPFGAIDRFCLDIHIKGTVKFDVLELKGEVPIDHKEIFARNNSARTMKKNTVDRYKEGAVDELIKKLIIRAIKNFRYSGQLDVAEVEYKALISEIKKHSVELHLKPRDFEER